MSVYVCVCACACVRAYVCCCCFETPPGRVWVGERERGVGDSVRTCGGPRLLPLRYRSELSCLPACPLFASLAPAMARRQTGPACSPAPAAPRFSRSQCAVLLALALLCVFGLWPSLHSLSPGPQSLSRHRAVSTPLHTPRSPVNTAPDLPRSSPLATTLCTHTLHGYHSLCVELSKREHLGTTIPLAGKVAST